MLRRTSHTRSVNRDRHGRGLRASVLFAGTPAWRTRAEAFDEEVSFAIEELTRQWPDIEQFEFAVEDVPPSTPASWESNDVILGRLFPRQPRLNLANRIVLYRLPILDLVGSENLRYTIKCIIMRWVNEVLFIPESEMEKYRRF